MKRIMHIHVAMLKYSKRIGFVLVAYATLWATGALAQSAVVSSYNNANNFGDEWTEILVLQDNLDMQGWTLRDNNGSQGPNGWNTPITFNNIPLWANVRAGTVILVWHRKLNSGGTNNSQDVLPEDGYLELWANDPLFFTGGDFAGNTTLNIANSGDIVQLRDQGGVHIHALGHMAAPGPDWNALPLPKLNHNIASLGGNNAVFVIPGNDATYYGTLAPQAGNSFTNVAVAPNTTRGLPNWNATWPTQNAAFWRLTREPLWPVQNFTAVTQAANTQVLLSWTAATDPWPSDNTVGYIILKSASNTFGTPADGHTYLPGDALGGSTVVDMVPNSQPPTYTENISIPCGTSMYYRIYTYRYSTDNLNGNDYPAAPQPLGTRGRAYNTSSFGMASLTAPLAPAVQTMTGNTSYCAGSGGTIIGLTNSELNVNYELFQDCGSGPVSVQGPIAGTGAAISFLPQTIVTPGPCTFSVVASFAAFPNCTTPMLNTIIVTELPSPTFTPSATPPTTCGGSDGIITLTGLTASTAYTVNYINSLGTPIGPLSLSSDATGNLVLTGSPFPAGNYSGITLTLNGCNSVAGTVIIPAFVPVAPTGITASQTTICGDGLGTITLTANGGSGTSIEWFAVNCNTAVIGNGTTLTVNPSPTVTTTYYARWTTATCGSSNCASVLITVETPPTIAYAGPNQSICGQFTATLAATAASVGTGAWSVSSSPAGSTVTFANPALNSTGVTVNLIGTYIFQWTVSPAAGGLCLPTSSLVTIIFDNAITVNAASNTPVCSGDSLKLFSDIAGATYAWTGPNGFTSTDQNPIIPGAITTTAYTGTYTVTVTNIPGGCPTTTNTTNVVVEQSAIPATSAASSLGSLCSDDAGNITLSVIGGNGDQLNWYVGGCPGTVIGTGDNLLLASPTVTTTYYAGWSSANCGTAACAPVTVTVTDPPTIANAGPSAGYCGTLNATLAGNSPVVGTGTWSKVSGTGTITFANNTLFNTGITASVLDTYMLRWTISTGTDCPASSSDVTITFSNALQVNAGYNLPACEGSLLQVTSDIAGATYAWTGPNGFTSNQQSPVVTNNATPAQNGTYHVDVTNITGGCPPTSDDIIVALVPIPVTPAITSTGITGATQDVCNGTTVIYSITPPTAGSTYAWTLSGGGTLTPNANQASVVWSTVGGPYTVSVTETSAAGCPGTPVSVGVTVNTASAPTVLVTASDNPACLGATVNFNAAPTNGGTSPGYQWKKNNTLITGETNSTFGTNTLLNGDIISCVLTSSLACAFPLSIENMVNMIINPLLTPAVSIVANNNPTCPGGTVEFTATPANEGATPGYQWELNSLPVGGNSATYSSNTFVQGDEIICSLTSSELCADPKTVASGIITIDIGAGLAISIAPGDTLCSGFSYVLDPGAGYVSYTWFDGRNDQTITASEVGTYGVTVTDQYGCKGADSVYLKACADEFAVPTAFTPNHDNVNDFFRPVWKADVTPTSFKLLIYDQWGRLVFSGDNYLTGWDGNDNGNPCPMGVYAYYLSVEKPAGKSPAQQSTLRGLVTLVR